jgi:hypothetical protein
MVTLLNYSSKYQILVIGKLDCRKQDWGAGHMSTQAPTPKAKCGLYKVPESVHGFHVVA